MIRGAILLVLAGIPVAGIVGCNTAPQARSDRMDLKTEADRVVAEAQRTDPTLRDVMANSLGYAVFPDAGKGGFIIGGGYGKGVLYERGVMTGYCDLTHGSVGATIGGQSFTEILVFRSPAALNDFRDGDFTLGADATVVALKAGAAANAQARTDDEMLVFITSQTGLMADASITGQNFRFTSATELGDTVQPAGGQIQGSGTRNMSSPNSRHY